MFPEFGETQRAPSMSYACPGTLRDVAQSEQLAHDHGAVQAGSDILTSQWANADDEVDLGDLFLGISMDGGEPGTS